MDLSRVVDVLAPIRPDETEMSFGSGYLVAPGLVLTARHVVCDDKGNPRADPTVRFLADGKAWHCRVAWTGQADLDGALLELAGPVPPYQPVRWGQLVSSQAGIPCEAAGFPRSMKQDDRLRDVEHMRGQINAGTGLLDGRIYVDVTSARPQPGGWAGMSGAALWSGSLLVGVVASDMTAFAAGRLAVEPVTRLLADKGFRALIGPDAVVESVELAQRRPIIAVPGPAYLLRADAETARFRSRDAELAKLAAWCSGTGVRVRLLTGPGGQGKTRLARELCLRLASVGTWTAELLTAEARLPSGIRRPLLVVIDYADTRPQQVQEIILAALAEPGHTPIRVLLLARSAGDWWERLRTGTAELEMGLAGAIVEELAPLEDTTAGRRQAFSEALLDYGRALEAACWPCAAPGSAAWPDLADDTFGSPLRLQMTALAALLGDGMASAGPAEDVILRHEARYWMRTATQHHLPLHEESLRCAVTAASLCGAADLPQAIGLLSHVPRLWDQSEDTRVRTARWLRDLYAAPADSAASSAHQTGERRYWGSLEPDLVAEHLVADVIREIPGFLARMLEQTSPDQDHQALTVLARAAVDRPDLAGSISGLLSGLPRLASAAVTVITQAERPAALTGALTRLVEHENLPAELLADIAMAIPRDTRALSRLAITIEHQLLAARERLAKDGTDAYLPDLADSLANLSMRLSQSGRSAEGLPLAQRATDLFEHLATNGSHSYLAGLAVSLSNLSAHLAQAGRREDALAAIRRALAVYDRLAGEDPDSYLPALASMLGNLSLILSEAGRREDALAAIQRAVAIWEDLAEDNPGIYLEDLAKSLISLAPLVGEGGLVAAERAVGLYERLAERSPDAYLADLASALEDLSAYLAQAGRREDALAASQRAVAIRERLIAADGSDADVASLAGALNDLAASLDEAGRQDDALAVTQRTVDIYERLAGHSPDAHHADLAKTLSFLSVQLSHAGRSVEAMAAVQRAVALFEPLAQDDPDTYLADLAMSLSDLASLQGEAGLTARQRAVGLYERLAENSPDTHSADLATALSNLSAQLFHAGRSAEAMAAVQRAVGLYEQLAEDSPDTHSADLARALSNLSGHLSAAGRGEEAMAAVQRAVGLYEGLAEDSSDAHLAVLATALTALAKWLDEAGRQEGAMAAIQRAVAIRERLAEDQPEHYLPELAVSLSGLSVVLGKAGLAEEGLAAAKRAVGILEPLVQDNPDVYLEGLVTSLINLSLRLCDVGHPEEALATGRRAVAFLERLTDTSPVDYYLPELAALFNNVSVELSQTGKQEQALAAIQRAVDAYERLAVASPDVYLPHLMTSLINLSLRLRDLGRPEEALPARQRAVAIQERLAHVPGWAAPPNKMSMESPARAPRPGDSRMKTQIRSPAPKAAPGSDKCDWPTCKFVPLSDAQAGLYRGWCWRHGRYRACWFHHFNCPDCEYRRKLRAERA